MDVYGEAQKEAKGGRHGEDSRKRKAQKNAEEAGRGTVGRQEEKTCHYMAIDLKSFYASCECRERGLDPMDAYLVVADGERTVKTICLAVSPALKAYGVPGRARLFEVVEKVRKINYQRVKLYGGQPLVGKSCFDSDCKTYPFLAVNYITAPPRMALYMAYSRRVYEVYLQFVSKEDIHVYSVDEVFMDLKPYERIYQKSSRALAEEICRRVYEEVGMIATVGLGENLYLAKVAMDIEAKHMQASKEGIRLAMLTEQSYRESLWQHKPLHDFWRIGRGIENRLAHYGIYTMGDIALAALSGSKEKKNQALLYKLFGIQAELLIDHAFGYETCKIEDIKAFHSKSNSLHSGQVLPTPYGFTEGRMVAEEMAEDLALDLLKKGKDSAFVQLYLSFDEENAGESYEGKLVQNHYGKRVPKSVHGLYRFPKRSNQGRVFREAVLAIYDRIMDRRLRIRKLSISAEDVRDCEALPEGQLDLFQHFLTSAEEEQELTEKAQFLEKEEKARGAALEVMEKFGKNALLKGYQYLEGARGRERNRQIGGHNSGVSDLASIRRKEESTIAKNIVEGQDYER